MNTIPYEHLLSINKFEKPTVAKDNDAVAILITRLILLEPGTIQSHPDMGVGLISRYRYSETGNIESLRRDISDQISKYLPTLAGANVEVSVHDKETTISVTADNIMYTYTFDANTNTLSLKEL